ncbi:MAG: polymer-forming cytoskeletal protein [bacterium]
MKVLLPITVLLTLNLAFVAAQPAFAQEPEAAAAEAAATGETAATAETAATGETALAEKLEELDELCGECEEGGGEDRVVIGQDLVIEEGEVVEGDAVCIGGNLTVKGTVNGDVVCVGGHLRVGPTAVICCDVVSVGGVAVISPQAEVGGEQVSVEGGIPGLKGLKWFGVLDDAVSDFSKRIVEVVKEVVFFGFLMLVALLLTVFLPRQFGRIDEHLDGDFPRSALLGVGIMILLPVALVLMAVSIIGIPLIPIVILAAVVAIFVGYVVMARIIGRRLVGEKHVMFQIFIGLLLLHGAALLGDIIALPGGPMEKIGGVFAGVGKIIFIAASGIGMGAVVYSRFGKRTLAETEAAREAKKNNKTPPPAKTG